MKEISRRSFLRTSALAGTAAVLAGAAPLATGAASPAAVPEENCLDSLGTAVASLGNGTPVLPSVVGLSRGSIMGYCENGIYTFKGIPYGTHQRFKYAAPVEQYGTPDQPTNALTNGYDLRSLISFAGDPMTVHAAASAPAVYEYLVAYTMPYFGGMTMTHTSDLGFWFHSVDTVPYQIAGDEANAHHLSDQMTSALAAFCATGDPSTRRLPWDRYTAAAPRTMVFDVRSACKDSSFDDGLQAILGR